MLLYILGGMEPILFAIPVGDVIMKVQTAEQRITTHNPSVLLLMQKC